MIACSAHWPSFTKKAGLMVRVSLHYLEKLIREWQQAFAIANDKTAPAVTWERGWFVIGAKRYRRAEFEKMRNELRFRAYSRPLSSQESK